MPLLNGDAQPWKGLPQPYGGILCGPALFETEWKPDRHDRPPYKASRRVPERISDPGRGASDGQAISEMDQILVCGIGRSFALNTACPNPLVQKFKILQSADLPK